MNNFGGLERKVYPGYAFTSGEKYKSLINLDIYNKDLKHLAKKVSNEEPSKEELAEYMCYKYIGVGYGTAKYLILSNPKNLTQDQLALICDEGNLCFGYRMEDGLLLVYTD